MRSISLPSFAKINLDLRILGTRPDGFHDLKTIFQSLALFDTVTVTVCKGPLVITPHPGEMAALLGPKAIDVAQARLSRDPMDAAYKMAINQELHVGHLQHSLIKRSLRRFSINISSKAAKLLKHRM